MIYRLAVWNPLGSVLVVGMALGLASAAAAEEVVIDFEQVPIRLDPQNDELINRLERYEEQGVEFKLARQPERSKARGRIMFFPHISSGRKGLLNAMASEQQIPVQVRFSQSASAVTIVFWASTGASAKLEAFNRRGEVVARDELKVVPGRQRPEDAIPTFTLKVAADEISYVEFSGPRTGEFLAADEVRFTPLERAP
ncbi:MAG: hypothetical protein MUF06_23700 [Pirellulaceae bacterium]|nr:hypothetical protein [Pirellulaceae bacterium]